MSIKLLYMIQCTNFGGMERTSSEQARLMHARHGVDYRAISPRAAGKGAYMFEPIDPAMTFGTYRGRFNLFGQRAFTAKVAELARDVDMIYVTGTCVSSLRAANATGKPVILANHFHHGGNLASRAKWWLFYNLLCRKLKAVLFVSPFTRDEALAIAPWLAGKVQVFRQSIDAPDVSPAERAEQKRAARERLGLPQDAFVIGNAGWLIPRKRFDVFLDVAARVKDAIPHARFVICGDGESADALKAQAKRLGLADRVEFRGWVADLEDHRRAWDVMLFNSDYDATGRSVFEAAAHGINLVASLRYGGLSEFFAEGDRGYFFAEHDIDAMARALIRIHADPAHAAAQAAEALAHLRATYTPDAATAPIRALTLDAA